MRREPNRSPSTPERTPRRIVVSENRDITHPASIRLNISDSRSIGMAGITLLSCREAIIPAPIQIATTDQFVRLTREDSWTKVSLFFMFARKQSDKKLERTHHGENHGRCSRVFPEKTSGGGHGVSGPQISSLSNRMLL